MDKRLGRRTEVEKQDPSMWRKFLQHGDCGRISSGKSGHRSFQRYAELQVLFAILPLLWSLILVNQRVHAVAGPMLFSSYLDRIYTELIHYRLHHSLTSCCVYRRSSTVNECPCKGTPRSPSTLTKVCIPWPTGTMAAWVFQPDQTAQLPHIVIEDIHSRCME